MPSSQSLSILILETRQVTHHTISLGPNGEIDFLDKHNWDPQNHLNDPSGQRFFDELSRQTTKFWGKKNFEPDGIAISMPGSLDNNQLIKSSSRLGIRSPFNVAEWSDKTFSKESLIFHDVECLALGEYQCTGNATPHQQQCLVYVFVDEGVGSKIIIDGKPYTGAGLAGSIGRMVVQPDGEYYEALRSSGSLEVFTSRPWISKSLVSTYLSEIDKKFPEDTQIILDSKFRKALKVAAQNDRESLTLDRIADGLNTQDPVALHVLDKAARYLGFALNSILSIINPQQIILSGGIITELPNFSDLVIRHTRQLSWPLAWNNTLISISKLGREAQIYGAVELWKQHSN